MPLLPPGKPSFFYIEAIEDTEVLIINYDKMQQLYAKSQNGERLGRLICEQVYLFIAERNLSLLVESPEQRYQKMMAERQKIGKEKGKL